MSIEFYDKSGNEFARSTNAIDMSPIYDQFVPLMPAHACILDAGCGSGRDTAYFRGLGYDVDAFDASKVIVDAASKFLNSGVRHCSFEEFATLKHYQGIWACASLLHLESSRTAPAIQHLAGFLAMNGFFYASFKYGKGWRRSQDGRQYLDLDEPAAIALDQKIPDLVLYKLWTSEDQRSFEAPSKWLNILWQKVG